MADEKNLPERLLELAVYVPIGVAAALVEELPALAEKGREKVSGQVQVARMLGKMAVSEAGRRFRPPPPRPTTAPPAPPSRPPRPEASAPPAKPARAAKAGPAPSRRRPATASKAAPPAPGGPAETPSASSLPIPGYDTLAASQVVQRLGSLSPEELDAVRRYEVATRGRRTILHRIAQLSSEEGRASA